MLKTEAVCQYLRSSQFLSTASEDTIQDLARQVHVIRVEAGQKIFDKGEAGAAIYFVMEGCVRVHDGDTHLTYRGAGEAFGEIGALTCQVRTASVTAETTGSLLKLDKSALFETMTRRPETAFSVIEALCQRESTLINESTERAIKAQITERELAIAQQIQRGFLPDVVPLVPGWNLAGFLKPAREVAGDFYDFFVLPRLNCVGLVIGDVCDKGVGAALFMTLFRSLIRSTSLYHDFSGQDADPTDIPATLHHSITLTNQYVATTHGQSSMFASVFSGLLVPETGQLFYINAGHESPLIVGPGGVRESLGPTGPVIGLFPDARHEVGVVEIAPGEKLVAYTDGATDAKNEADEQFSEARLLALLAESDKTADAVVQDIVAAVEEFIGDASQYDDITIIAASREPR